MVAEASINEPLSPRILRRLQDRKEWEQYWQIRKIESDGTYFPKLRYLVHKAVDFPATWFRESIVEPLHDRYSVPYYQRRIDRVTEIDDCGVNDRMCQWEANEQFRLDKMVDYYILQILRDRYERCSMYHRPLLTPCHQVIEDMEENELNFFIKYGELGSEGTVKDAYMKQKHRMIWERRHPEIMKAREEAVKAHKEKLKNGEFDMSFWKKGLFYQDKKDFQPPYEFFLSKSTVERDQPLSKDWQYYKKLSEDPEFDKEQGKQSSFTLF